MDIPRILIVDNDVNNCRSLELILKYWDMSVRIVGNPLFVTNEVKKNCYDVVLLDVFAPEMHGINLLSSIRRVCPDIKIILMAKNTDKTTAIKAFRMGIYDFIEKPIIPELCSYAVKRATDTQKIERQYRKALEEIKQRNTELLEVNESLAELAKMIDRVRKATARQTIQQIRVLLVPLIENLRQDKALKVYEAQLVRLLGYVEDIMSGVATNLQVQGMLSLREMQMALMIRDGMTNEEIATHLNISAETVKVHRRNIRKKLGIRGTKNKLSIYLHSLADESAVQGHPYRSTLRSASGSPNAFNP